MSSKSKLGERIVSTSKAFRIAKASRLGIIVSGILIFLIFAIAYYGEVVGNFTFKVDRKAFQAGIAIYSDPLEKKYRARLIADKVEQAYAMTSLCGTEYSDYRLGDDVCIPPDEEFIDTYGSNNHENYLAYTFFMENTGEKYLDVEAKITLIQATRGAEESLRVRVIIDGEGTTYALPQSKYGANPGEPEVMTEPFATDFDVMIKEFILFKPDDVVKITVILWYEGEDIDHNVNIIGGGVKLDMVFNVNKTYSDEDLIITTTTNK